MQDRLNFFEPWERIRLTTKISLRAHSSSCCVIAPSHIRRGYRSLMPQPLRRSVQTSPGWPCMRYRPTFDTQRAQILRSEFQPRTNEPIKGISVLCSADASSEVQGAVLESDRGQVLDGIIRYGDHSVIVLKSNLHKYLHMIVRRVISIFTVNQFNLTAPSEGSLGEMSWLPSLI